MDALLLALLLTLVLDQGTGTQHSVARFGNNAHMPGSVDTGRVIGLALMVMANAIVAATLGSVMAALLMPDARLLFLAIALLFGGGGLLLAPFRKTKMVAAPPFRSRFRSILGLALRRAGENGAFAVAGIVAFTDAPILAAIGATLGGWVALAPPLALGSRYTRHGLLNIFQLVAGGILLCIALACAVNALRII